MICFDTDVISAVIRGMPPAPLVRRLALVPAAEQATTAITVGELVYGATRKGSPALVERVREVVQRLVAVLPVDEQAAVQYGRLRARLERAGRPLAGPDLWIAAVCLARDATLVTGNVKHFARVPGLRVENWLLPNDV